MRLRSLERVSRISPLLSTSVKRLTLGSSHHCLSSFFALPVRVLIPGTFTSRPCFPAGWTVGRKFQCRQAEAKAGKNHAHHLHPTSHLSAPRDANQHLQSAVQRNLLVSLEGRSSQAPHLPITDPMPAPLPPPKIPPSKALAPAPVAVCSMLVRPRPPDSIAPSTSTFSFEGA